MLSKHPTERIAAGVGEQQSSSCWDVKGPPTGPLEMNPARGVIRRSSGTSKASWMPVVVELAGEVALKPMPRLAKAAHNSF